MFTPKPNYTKLKTNLRLAINRLQLLEKKKTELAQKARREIADYLASGKHGSAKIRVEHIICEDYMVEAMELTEVFCGLLLSRFGLVQQMRGLDEGLAEVISSILWVTPRLQADVPELKLIADQLMLKYGKPYAQACRNQHIDKISKRLIQKMSVQAPSKVLVEKYLIEIAKIYNVKYEPDPQVMGKEASSQDLLTGLDESESGNNSNGAVGVDEKAPPSEVKWYLPEPTAPLSHLGDGTAKTLPSGAKGGAKGPSSESPPLDPYSDPRLDKMYNYMQSVSGNSQWNGMIEPSCSPPPAYTSMLPRGHMHEVNSASNDPNMTLVHSQPDDHQLNPGTNTHNEEDKSDSEEPILSFLPSVPDDPSDGSDPHVNQDINFDELNRRFLNLKRRK